MKCRILRGAKEIGGNCVEVESSGKRIIIDLGLPLDDGAPKTLPNAAGITESDPSLLGLIISHPHPDHYGLTDAIATDVPVYICDVAVRIIEIGEFFTPLPGLGSARVETYRDGEAFQLGPFRITPMRMDHSAYGNYCLLIEAKGKRLLYSGDIRGHGRQSHLFENLLSVPPSNIDVLMCEGTQVGVEREFDFPDERSVQSAFADLMCDTKGVFLAWCSSQNIDRVMSLIDAAAETSRTMIVDVYTAEILKASKVGLSPMLKDGKVRVFLPNFQRMKIKRTKAFNYVKPYYPFRIYPGELASTPSDFSMLCRPSMLPELRDLGLLPKATLVSSLWSGYVKRDPDFLSIANNELDRYRHIHTSGHATIEELERFVGAFPDSRVVPIHTNHPESFPQHFKNTELHADGEWWEV